MGQTRKIICPSCNTILTVGYFEGIEAKSFPCPKCHNTHKYTEYRPFKSEEPEADKTDLRKVIHQKASQEATPGNAKDVNGDCTQYDDPRDSLIGRLAVSDSGQNFQLKKGRNVIGREASSSNADIRIPDDTQTMSREHFYIDVMIQDGKVVHILSVCQTAKNKTLLNDVIVGTADKMVLRDGYRIIAGRISLLFSIPK